MKTSNKILVGFLTTLFILAISFLFYIKTNTIEITMIKSEGEVKTETYNLTHLHTLDAGAGDVYFYSGEPKVEISCGENVKQYFDQGFENGEFYIRKKEGVENELDIKIKVYSNDLEKIILSNQSRGNASDIFKTERLNIETYNSASLNIKTETNFLDITSYNNSFVEVMEGGTSNHLKASLFNNARVFTNEVKILEVDASVYNSAFLAIHPIEKLSVNISNNGLVEYSGNPEIVKQQINNSGRLQKMDN